jgi:hypothetical protein
MSFLFPSAAAPKQGQVIFPAFGGHPGTPLNRQDTPIPACSWSFFGLWPLGE